MLRFLAKFALPLFVLSSLASCSDSESSNPAAETSPITCSINGEIWKARESYFQLEVGTHSNVFRLTGIGDKEDTLSIIMDLDPLKSDYVGEYSISESGNNRAFFSEKGNRLYGTEGAISIESFESASVPKTKGSFSFKVEKNGETLLEVNDGKFDNSQND